MKEIETIGSRKIWQWFQAIDMNFDEMRGEKRKRNNLLLASDLFSELGSLLSDSVHSRLNLLTVSDSEYHHQHNTVCIREKNRETEKGLSNLCWEFTSVNSIELWFLRIDTCLFIFLFLQQNVNDYAVTTPENQNWHLLKFFWNFLYIFFKL